MLERQNSDPFSRLAEKRGICPQAPTQPLPHLPVNETQARIDAVIHKVESTLTNIEASHDELANSLVEHLFQDNPAYALDPNRHPTAEYKAISDMAGTTLRLDSGNLSRHIRIGALNKLLGMESPWGRLSWSFKVELLPTLQLDDAGGYLSLGVDEASKPDMSIERLRAWKKALKEGLPKSDKPAPGGLDLGGFERLVAHGDKLRSKRAQTEFLKKIARLPDEEQADAVRRLLLAARNIVITLNRYGELNGLPGFTLTDEETIGGPEQEEGETLQENAA